MLGRRLCEEAFFPCKKEKKMAAKRQLAFSIIKHLKNESASGEHDEDISESLEGNIYFQTKLLYYILIV